MYHIAALYYEMKIIFQTFLSQEIQEADWKKTIRDHSLVQLEDTETQKYDILQREIDCPEYLDSLVIRIMHLEKNMYTNSKMKINEIFVELEEIKNVFAKSNIIFVVDKKPKECKIKETDLANYKLQTDEIIKDTSTLFNACYLNTNFNVRSTTVSDTAKMHVYAADDDDDNNNTNVNTELLEEKAREENLKSKTSELPENTEAESSGIPETSETEEDKYTVEVPTNFRKLPVLTDK